MNGENDQGDAVNLTVDCDSIFPGSAPCLFLYYRTWKIDEEAVNFRCDLRMNRLKVACILTTFSDREADTTLLEIETWPTVRALHASFRSIYI